MSRSKTQKYKIGLERRGNVFPESVDFGSYNRQNNVYRARFTLKTAHKAFKEKNFAEAMDECRRTLFLLTIEKVRDPLIEVDRVAVLVALVVQVKSIAIHLCLLYTSDAADE